MIHVCYAIYDPRGTYSKFVGASICSLFENTSEPVTIHILHDETLTDNNRRKFIDLAAMYQQKIEFHLTGVDEDIKEFMKTSPLSPATLYRLNMANLLPESTTKAIYLDADIIVNMDINQLWNEINDGDLMGAVLDTGVLKKPGTYKRFPLLATGDVDWRKYFNAGVLVVNLDKLRDVDNFYHESMRLFGERTSYFIDNDQGLLNHFFADQYKPIDDDYNRQLVIEKRMGLRHVGRAIYHYINNSVGVDPNDEFDQLFWHYFIKTPWFDESVYLDSVDKFQRAVSHQQIDLMKTLYTCGQKIFWGSNTLRDATFDLINYLQIDDAIFLDNDEANYYLTPRGGGGDVIENPIGLEDHIVIDNLIEQLERSTKRAAFILSSNYRYAYFTLMRRGFKEGVDFFDGRVLLPDATKKFLFKPFDVIKNI